MHRQMITTNNFIGLTYTDGGMTLTKVMKDLLKYETLYGGFRTFAAPENQEMRDAIMNGWYTREDVAPMSLQIRFYKTEEGRRILKSPVDTDDRQVYI